MKKNHIVIVEWVDSQTTFGWQKADKEGASPIYSVGWLIHKTKGFVVLSTSRSGGGNYVDQITIPKCSITKFKYLKT